MKLKLLSILILLLPLSAFSYNPVAFLEYNSKTIYRIDLNLKKSIKVLEAGSNIASFHIIDNKCIYVDEGGAFFLEDLKSQKKTMIKKGQLYYNRKKWGDEKFLNIQISSDMKYCIFSFGPSYEIYPDIPGKHYLWGNTKLNHRFTMDIADIGIINLMDKSFRNITKNNNGFNQSPVFLQDKIFYQSYLRIVEYSVNNDSQSCEIAICKNVIVDDGQNMSGIITVDSKKLYFVQLDIFPEYIKKIFSYDSESSSCQLLFDELGPLKIKYDDIYDFDPEQKLLLFLMNERSICLYDLVTKKKRVIFETNAPLKEMFFIK